MKGWMIAVGAVLVLIALLLLSDRRVEAPGGISVLRNNDEYRDASNKAGQLSIGIFQKADNGEVITDDDKAKLTEAGKHFDAMCIYEPRYVMSFYASGKCHMLLGNKQKAGERFEQAVLNRDTDIEKDSQYIKLTVFESSALLSEVMLDLGAEEIANYNTLSQANDVKGAEEAKKRAQIYYQKAMESANRAVEGVPTAPRYLVDRANCYLAVNQKDLAKADILKAKSLAPTDPRVKMAVRMMGL